MKQKMKKLAVFMICAVFLGSIPTLVFAQKDITGKVTDAEKDKPLEGATVFENISKNSTVTGRDGSFTLRVATNAKTVTVSYVGYGTMTVPITGSELVVKLSEDSSKPCRSSAWKYCSRKDPPDCKAWTGRNCSSAAARLTCPACESPTKPIAVSGSTIRKESLDICGGDLTA